MVTNWAYFYVSATFICSLLKRNPVQTLRLVADVKVRFISACRHRVESMFDVARTTEIPLRWRCAVENP